MKVVHTMHSVRSLLAQHCALYRSPSLPSSSRGVDVSLRRISVSRMVSSKELETMVRREPVEFTLNDGQNITVDSVIQDTLPSGSQLGTVVAIHGAPGSHKDFKYITPLLHEKGIRTIGVNFPHYGMTEGHHLLNYDNVERDNYVKAVIDTVGLKEKVVVMGHSRGCENATGSASLVTNLLCGLVLLNPTGLRLHRGLRPFWGLQVLIWLYDLGSLAQKIMHPILLYFYNNVLGLRLDTGERAMMCMRTMSHIELAGLKPKIQKINDAEKARVLVAYAGKDILIEREIAQELAHSFTDHKEVMCPDNSEEENKKAIKATAALIEAGTKSVSVEFAKEGHFLQKHRAKYIADSIEAMLKAA